MIRNEIEIIRKYANDRGMNISDEYAFNILVMQYVRYKTDNLDSVWNEILESVTDKSNDGGIDFLSFDEDDEKVIIGQSKYTEKVTPGSFADEMRKIRDTISDFRSGRTGKYNNKLKKNLQNSLDRLTDETDGNIDVYFCSLGKLDEERSISNVSDFTNQVNQIHILNEDDLTEIIGKIKSDLEIVSNGKLDIDSKGNSTKYETDDSEGIFLNISSESLTKLYNRHNTEGLFNLNIRRYIKNKNVDDGINRTLNGDRDKFWFLNNGITIACKDFYLDGTTVKLTDFSIVNGGQTTTLIGTYKGNNNDIFYLPCKIIKSKENLSKQQTYDFFNEIAEATNSQKPIQPKDLKANAREMIFLQKGLADRQVFLGIKRGISAPKKFDIRIQNDEFAQLFFSFVYQRPGTARSNKKSLFSVNKNYASVFKLPYQKKPELLNFCADLARLNDRYNIISKKISENTNNYFDSDEAIIFKNGKMTVFALMGILYSIVNEDVEIGNIYNNIVDNEVVGLTTGLNAFISNYSDDDIDDLLLELIQWIVSFVQDRYKFQYSMNQVTSESNFLKTDSKYRDDIVKEFESKMRRKNERDAVMRMAKIFKRLN